MTLQNLKMAGRPRAPGTDTTNSSRMKAYRARNGVTLSIVVPTRTMASINALMGELGSRSQRALIIVAIDILEQTVARGALRKVES